MTDSAKNALTILSLESLALLERHRAELERSSDHVVNTDELLVYTFLIEKLRFDVKRDEHLAEASLRIDKLERERTDDRLVIDAVVRDAATTRRLTVEFGERVDILASNFGAVFDKLSEVAASAERQAKQLGAAAEAETEEARLRDK